MELQGMAGGTSFGHVLKRDGRLESFNPDKVMQALRSAAGSYEHEISLQELCAEVKRTVFDGITAAEVEKACILAAVSFIERDPAYDVVATRLLLKKLFKEVVSSSVSPQADNITDEVSDSRYRTAFVDHIMLGVAHGFLSEALLEYPLQKLAAYLEPDRDKLFAYMGLHTLYERYLLKIDGRKVEMPQSFLMRIAMGLAIREENPFERACEFYDLMSKLLYMPSTPTLFHSGFPVAQLSSCFLTTVHDDLGHIFKCLGDNAQLAKWAGGIGTDWTNLRSTGSLIKGIKATSQGVIPYLKIANDVVVAITRSGIRRGGKCAYLESWHLDIEDFLDLRRNTGDERRRTHDMNTANWIPDLFMKRVESDGQWTLFSPVDVPDLHSLYGRAFESRYEAYEQQTREGTLKNFKTIPATQLWRKMLTRLFETGHAWITFKDPCNVRSPQDHVGVINSSNLCTEITLNTSETETAVCNLGSINLGRHMVNGALDRELLKSSIRTAVRMLDNVIDLNFYPTIEAKASNMRHRPIGLGMMGFQDALYEADISFASPEALTFADEMGEYFSYCTIEASSDLAAERGAYESFGGSKWDRGIFPLDTVDLLERERGVPIRVSRTARLDWGTLKQKVKRQGIRNSNMMAVAPTATIGTIVGSYPSIEPIYKNIYVKSNVSGEFTVVNKYLVSDLKKLGLWTQQIRDQLKYYDGDLAKMSLIPESIKYKFQTAFELDPAWLVDIAAARAKWIDQSQSYNVFMLGVSGKRLDALYRHAWHAGMKTTYYLRMMGATQIEKSTLDAATYGFTQTREYKSTDVSSEGVVSSSAQQAATGEVASMEVVRGAVCNLSEDPSCESCQ